MKDCKKYEKDFVAFLYGEIEDKDRRLMESHLDGCVSCRREIERLKKIFQGADSLSMDIEEAMASVDWEALPRQISENVFKQKGHMPQESWLKRLSSFLAQPRLKPVYAGVLLGILIGSAMTFFVLRAPLQQGPRTGGFYVSPNFLERVELEMARRETLEYLERSQYLLLDFIQSPSEKSAEFWQSEFVSQKTRGLLEKKKYINSQLDKFQMAKAKMICDQIELLFYELTQISVSLSAEEVKRLQTMIEDKQILLKINLLKRELEKSEV